MQGQVLDYSVQTNEGIITGSDGNRYTFAGAEWNESSPPARGMRVDFEAQGTNAVGIYRALGGGGVDLGTMFSAEAEKNRIIAGVLAIVLGQFGVHKFYLGHKQPAFIQLGLGAVGYVWMIFFSIVGIFAPFVGLIGVLGWLAVIAAGVLGVIEGIMYLIKTDEEFEARYALPRNGPGRNQCNPPSSPSEDC